MARRRKPVTELDAMQLWVAKRTASFDPLRNRVAEYWTSHGAEKAQLAVLVHVMLHNHCKFTSGEPDCVSLGLKIADSLPPDFFEKSDQLILLVDAAQRHCTWTGQTDWLNVDTLKPIDETPRTRLVTVGFDLRGLYGIMKRNLKTLIDHPGAR